MSDQEQGPAGEPPSDEGGYRVGPGKPPREHQWKPGQSGNPGGRPKADSLTAILRRRLAEEHNGKAVGEIIVEALIRGAAKGNVQHLREILDRVEGKVVERTRIEGAGSGGIVVLNIAPPKVLGQPEADRAAAAEHRRQVEEMSKQAPPNSKVLVGDCWLKA